MTFILGIGLGVLLTTGVSLLVMSDIDKDNDQF